MEDVEKHLRQMKVKDSDRR